MLKLILKKSFTDPLPNQYGGRSKWDPDRLKPWRKDAYANGIIQRKNANFLLLSLLPLICISFLLVKEHVEAQFDCQVSFYETQGFMSPYTPLTEVREIIRAIFFGHCNHSLFLFSIVDELNSNKAIFDLRVNLPIRFTPSGSPLLLLSVIDHQLIDQLVKEGNFDRETHEANYHLIITEGVSREVCVIRMSSTEEVDYLRFVLRWNSTRMRRTAWQSKNLPRGDDSPTRATFITPLYNENVCRCLQQTGILTNSKMLNHMLSCKPSTCCSNCLLKKIQLNRCAKCKIVFYCSRECQKNHWSSHKKVCRS